jgi:hypothetical protein
MENDLTILQEFCVGFGVSFGIYTTNILVNSDLLVVLKKRGSPHSIVLKENECLKLFEIFPAVRDIVTHCELNGTLHYMVHACECRQVYVRIERFKVGHSFRSVWSLVIDLVNGKRKVAPLSLLYLNALHSSNQLLMSGLIHWRQKRYTLSIMNILGIRQGPLTLKEECRWAILSKRTPNELLDAKLTDQLSPELNLYMHSWSTRDHMPIT